MQVEQIDRDAAAEYLALIVPSMPLLAEKVSENKTALSRAFARHRHQGRAEVVREIVAWLEEMYENCESIDGMLTRMDSKDELANMMQAKFGGRDAD